MVVVALSHILILFVCMDVLYFLNDFLDFVILMCLLGSLLLAIVDVVVAYDGVKCGCIGCAWWSDV